MAKVYYNRVVTKQITFDKVPARYKDQVFQIATEHYENGSLTPKAYKELFGGVIEESTDEEVTE